MKVKKTEQVNRAAFKRVLQLDEMIRLGRMHSAKQAAAELEETPSGYAARLEVGTNGLVRRPVHERPHNGLADVVRSPAIACNPKFAAQAIRARDEGDFRLATTRG